MFRTPLASLMRELLLFRPQRKEAQSSSRDRDAKQRWANQLGGGWGIGGFGGQMLAGVVKNSVGKVFR